MDTAVRATMGYLMGVLEKLGYGQTQVTRVTVVCGERRPMGTDSSNISGLNLVMTIHCPPTHPWLVTKSGTDQPRQFRIPVDLLSSFHIPPSLCLSNSRSRSVP